MADAEAVWSTLEAPWQQCVEEAWTSWCDGSAGVGAVLLDRDGALLATGRNRMLAPRAEPGVLADTPIAHAEMNALALVPLGRTVGATLYTSFEPCLMCASAVLQAQIGRVCYAAADPVFDGLHDWFGHLPFARRRMPRRDHLGGPVGAFCHVLHLSWIAFWTSPDGVAVDAHRRLAPRHLDIAVEVAQEGHLAAIAADGGSAIDALDVLWDRLDELAS